jgi:hypothetical protein
MRTGETWSRRRFLTGIAALGAAGRCTTPAAAEPPPETTTIRLVHGPQHVPCTPIPRRGTAACRGFAHLSYAKAERIAVIEKALASGEPDINLHFAVPLILRLEAGDPILILAGGHVGCFELFGTDRVRSSARSGAGSSDGKAPDSDSPLRRSSWSCTAAGSGLRARWARARPLRSRCRGGPGQTSEAHPRGSKVGGCCDTSNAEVAGVGYGVATTPNKQSPYVSFGVPEQSVIAVVSAKTPAIVISI